MASTNRDSPAFPYFRASLAVGGEGLGHRCGFRRFSAVRVAVSRSDRGENHDRCPEVVAEEQLDRQPDVAPKSCAQ